MQTLQDLSSQLFDIYDEHEARSIVRLLLEDTLNISFTDICTGILDKLTPEQSSQLQMHMEMLKKGIPVQQVTQQADFYGRRFRITPDTLIPRPETEELCKWLIDDSKASGSVHILDIGTGSGAIAVTLALEIADAKVYAWDISDKAIDIAQTNAQNLQANVVFSIHDILLKPKNDSNEWLDVIISNPPYIPQSDAEMMDANVLLHEPHLALFVPDNDPLIFYRAIMEYARTALKPSGAIYFELYPDFATQMRELAIQMGFQNVETRYDQFGKLRMMKVVK